MGVTGSRGIKSVTRSGEPHDYLFTIFSCQAKEEAVAERIDEFIVRLKELKQVASPFTLVSIEEL